MVEFYSLRNRRNARVPALHRNLVMLRNLCILHPLPVLVALLLAGCATVAPVPAPVPGVPSSPVPAAPVPFVEPPPPPVNLQGFPPSYRLGFGDGCSTGRGTDKRDNVRYANDGNYRTGWTDGHAQCRKR